MPTSKRLAGPGFIILNVLRAMNIIGLLAVCVASFIMVIKTFTASKFFFFDGATHIITALSSMFLVVSECSLFKRWYERNWPVLSNSHGFNFLGLAMIILGNNILGNLNKEATSQKSLGLPFWRIVIGSGVIVFSLGFINIIASLVFRDRKLKVTARQIRSKGAVALSDAEARIEAGKPGSIMTSFPSSSYAPSSNYSQASPIKVKSPVRRFMHNARQSILPSYRSEVPPYPRSPPGAYPASPVKSPSPAVKAVSKNDATGTSPKSPRPPMEISAPLNVNPQFAHLVRPNMAHHPSQRRPDGSF
ncbi:uncharacterized protein PV09_03799 [Verruconis gallopava]|uniref:DUF7598 domain-containing protein n=1 Tax=Verruconis gallopava TaxID=253628 RepID=A0A0D1YX21_9PEZI|nr:uncharacterized protein PV09_03799 [Verruconis gallopava]KIW05267.1 hypothetical protein PV09_03799 [Verruconis gallopava]